MRTQVLWIALLIVIVAIAGFFSFKPGIKGELPSEYAEAMVERAEAQDAGQVPVQQAKATVNPELLSFVRNNLLAGGPPKDGIPAIDEPRYVSAEEAERLGIVAGDDVVYGIERYGGAKAYPQSVMYWHEIVNEEFNGEKVSITYCPLTGSVIGFKGKNLGVSGELYNSNLVMYDRATDARIPQILGVGIEGALEGEKLEQVHVIVTTWEKWKEKYPGTLVLSEDTGYTRDYGRSPYPGYDEAYRVWFPLAAESDRFHTKKWVYGVELNGEFLAVPFEEFKAVGQDTVTLAGKEIQLAYDSELDIIRAMVNGKELPIFQVYWFAWYAYHPSTQVWSSQTGR